jgi:hypothetical protein
MDSNRRRNLYLVAIGITGAVEVAVLCSCSSSSSTSPLPIGYFAGTNANAQGIAGLGETIGAQGGTGQPVAGNVSKANAGSATAGKSASDNKSTSQGGIQASGGKVGGATGTAGKSGATGTTPRSGSSCLQAGSGQYTEPGPYKVVRKDGVDLASYLPSGTATPTTYSIWYPDPLETNCLHPIVVWGNGTTVTGPDVYDFFNRNGASWGMVVIGSDNSNVGSGQYHKAGIEYLLKENENPQSIFYHKLSTRAGTAGHSQGGMGATVGSAHPNVEAEVCVAGGGTVGAKVAFLCLTGTEDQVNAMCTATYNAAPGPAFLGDWQGGDHVTTETVGGYIAKNPGTLQMQRLYAAWFRCFLADDQVACAMFKGSPCGICKDSGWANIAGRNL